MPNHRRSFIKTSGAFAASTLIPSTAFSAIKTYKAAIIGRTGGGNYGHGFDVVFNGIENVSVVAVADENAEGLKKAAERSGAKNQYLDYKVMLEKEKPDMVAIGPRQPDCHREMALACINAGAHIYMEKPMTESLDAADDIIHAAEQKNVKVALGHTRRFMPDFASVKALIDQGFLGTVLEVRFQGKQDSRVGGEDFIVLGTHDFDIMRFYFGNPLWCFASITSDGHDISEKDVHMGHEPILVAGNTIRAQFAFTKNIHTYWTSIKTDDHWNDNFSDRQKWRFEIYGTKRILAYQSNFGMAYLDSPFPAHMDDKAIWKKIPKPKNWHQAMYEKHPIRNLIYAIETDTQPLCSGYDGRWTIEMLAAAYRSQIHKCRIEFPLIQRNNPLKELKK